VIKKLQYFRARLKLDFWVCEYDIKSPRGNGESGKFACHGKTHQEAMTDACAYVTRTAIVTGCATMSVRRPTFFERLFGE
jgi:hypothetical protein